MPDTLPKQSDDAQRRRPLDVRGRLHVETGEQSFEVNGEGNRVVIGFSTAGALKALVSGSGDKSGKQLNQLTSLLDRHGLDVVIQLKGQTIATLGQSAEPGAFEKVFSLEGVDVNFRQLAKALFKRGG